MQDPSKHRSRERVGLAARLDRAARDMNAVLLMLAIGLAALDFSCFFALQLRDAMPPVQRVDSAAAARQSEFGAAAGLTAPSGFGGGFAASQAHAAAAPPPPHAIPGR